MFVLASFLSLLISVTGPLRPPAYLDPGSGSFILQVLLATLLGGLFVVKSYWRKITSFFRRRSTDQQDDEEGQ